MRPPHKTAPIDRAQAEALAVSALGYIAADPALLPRFLSLTGIEAADVRRAAAQPGFLAGVLHFVAAHEPTLMAFAQETGTDPTRIRSALAALPGGDSHYDIQP